MVILFLSGCISSSQYGVQDTNVEQQITRINEVSALRAAGEYKKLESNLLKTVTDFSEDSYAKPRLYFELADLYSYQLLDIEKAIEFDVSLLSQTILDSDVAGNFLPKYNVANEVILGNQKYVNNYISINKDSIIKIAKERLENNRRLVSGSKNHFKSYAPQVLTEQISLVKRDIANGFASDNDNRVLMSRLIKAEYELKKVEPSFTFSAYKNLISGNITISTIDLSEIDFLSLADYFSLVYKQTGNVKFAEYALETVYLPYINLRKAANRWRYNTLINQYISTLIEANYKRHEYEDMIYYISLNKSRMLLEERLLVSQKNQHGNNLANNMDGIERNSSGLPDKQAFKRKLSGIDSFLDFYVDGHYSRERMATAKMVDRSTMPLTTRDFGIETNDDSVEIFIDSDVFLTSIQHGKVAGVEKISGRKLRALKHQLSSSLNAIAKRSDEGQRSNVLQRLAKKLVLSKQLTISPDKWIARHPLNFHLGTESVRSVSLFTEATAKRIDTINLLGFFNPTLDLSGAEQEADAIISKVPNAQIYKREAAQISQLNKEKDANIIHLSMHGGFNSKDPKNSKLYFAGAKRGMATDDPNALYAKDMGQYAILQDRQLIFAAACETGKISADQSNENELMGILRPLTANRNKNIILSLWKVDDQATKDFVAWFYQDLAQTHIVSTAFLSAQARVKSKYPNPYYWAAFYLSQAN